ncbi:MAG TPA: type II toxin-antitoxin system VapC family toxin [Candidatus Sulfotelmatobacter sp.]|nr:type II toxin-antitoxin system VapC family toxin [Candidatus Sulfotelmatobacter sp.]
MKALLDTHAFLWSISDDERLSRKAQQIFTGSNDLWLSVASIWEILIKVKSGKLPLPEPSGPYLVRELSENGIEVLPIKLDHVLRIENLTAHHRDPFDRILIAQSIEEKLPLVTADPVFERYPVKLIW